MPTKWSCACVLVPAAVHDVAGRCRPFDRRPCTPDWPTPPQSGHSPSHGSPSPCERSAAQFLVDLRPAWSSTSFRAIEFAAPAVPEPTQDGGRPVDIGHLAESLAAQSIPDLAERRSLGV